MKRATIKSPVKCLFELSFSVVADKLYKLKAEDYLYLKVLPNHMKNIVLKRFFYDHRIRQDWYGYILSILLNSETSELELPCRINDEDIACIKKCTRLKKLIMSKGISYITSTALNNIIQHLGQLLVLVLPPGPTSNNDVLKCISDNCPNLETLDLAGCKCFTDDGFLHLGACKNLKQLAISGTQVTDNGICSVVKGDFGQKLIEVRLTNCPNLSCKSAALIIQHCPNVKIMDIDFSDPDDAFFEATRRREFTQLYWTII